ncbi:MAG TPA: hypothetical protein VFQ76_08005 [Longimicrobiaceae bacterium]|nr:hypothetical protein [Longimicrobiaceae bacterium]
MTPSLPRRDRSPDPVRDHLKEVRRGLLRLHKALIDAERAVWERDTGPVSNGRFLQALIEDPFFAWLRPFSGLIVEVDERLATGEPLPHAEASAYVERIRALVQPTGDEAERYERVRQRDAGVLLAHVELEARIDAAPETA